MPLHLGTQVGADLALEVSGEEQQHVGAFLRGAPVRLLQAYTQQRRERFAHRQARAVQAALDGFIGWYRKSNVSKAFRSPARAAVSSSPSLRSIVLAALELSTKCNWPQPTSHQYLRRTGLPSCVSG